MSTALLPVLPALADRLIGEPLIVMLDVDGTLAPIAPKPDDAVVPPETRRIAASLAAREGVQLVLVSGRAASDARRMVSVANAWVIGNHGYEITGPNGEELVNPQLAAYRPAIAQAARRLAPQMAPVPGVIFEDKGWTLSIHYRLADPSVVPRLRGTVDETARALGLRVTQGKLVLEVRPPARVDKGSAVLMLAHQLGALKNGSSLVFAGDDQTDEDAFRALRRRAPEAVTVRVTHGEDIPTAAEFTVRDPAEMRLFLEWLLAARA
jgi:trehalose-phosphatase